MKLTYSQQTGIFTVERFTFNRKERTWDGDKGTRALHLSSLRQGNITLKRDGIVPVFSPLSFLAQTATVMAFAVSLLLLFLSLDGVR